MQVPKFHPLRFDDDRGDRVSLSLPVAASVCGVSLRTVQRWRTTGTVPAPALILLRLYAAGAILPDPWRRDGFRFAGGLLEAPSGAPFSSIDATCYALNMARLADLRRPPPPLVTQTELLLIGGQKKTGE